MIIFIGHLVRPSWWYRIKISINIDILYGESFLTDYLSSDLHFRKFSVFHFSIIYFKVNYFVSRQIYLTIIRVRNKTLKASIFDIKWIITHYSIKSVNEKSTNFWSSTLHLTKTKCSELHFYKKKIISIQVILCGN